MEEATSGATEAEEDSSLGLDVNVIATHRRHRYRTHVRHDSSRDLPPLLPHEHDDNDFVTTFYFSNNI